MAMLFFQWFRYSDNRELGFLLQREEEARKKVPDEERKKRLQRKGKKSEAEIFRETFLNSNIKCLFDLLFT